jgi:hypothetical protein
MQARPKANRRRNGSAAQRLDSAYPPSPPTLRVVVIEIVPVRVVRVAASQQESEQEERNQEGKKQFGFAQARRYENVRNALCKAGDVVRHVKALATRAKL